MDDQTPHPLDAAPAPVEAQAAVDALLGKKAPEPSLNPLADELATLADAHRRLAADFANYRRRTEEEKAKASSDADDRLLLRLLELADDLERAIGATPDPIVADPWHEGIRAIERKLATLLATDGVQGFDSFGAPFNPTRHEAIARVAAGENAAGIIVAEHRRGYLRGERVLRPALVSVAGDPD
jgi:molecular chaperone GrpE